MPYLYYKEIDKKTIFTIISKPINRYQFLIGKYIGLLITLFVIWFIMSIIFLTFVLIKASWDNKLLLALLSIYIEYIIITSIAIIFSSFSTPILSSIFSLCIFFIGHLLEGLKMLSKKLDSIIGQSIAMFFYYLLPNLERYNFRGIVVHGDKIEPSQIFLYFVYAMVYSVCLLLLSIAIFQRRNFI